MKKQIANGAGNCCLELTYHKFQSRKSGQQANNFISFQMFPNGTGILHIQSDISFEHKHSSGGGGGQT
jgi:hypothetical protein